MTRLPRMRASTSIWKLCLLAFGISAVTLIATDLTPFHEPLILHVLPIVIAAFLGGLVPGLVATGAMVLGAAFFLSAPRLSFAIDDPMERVEVISLLVTGVVVSILCETLRLSRRKEAKSAHRFAESFHESPIPLALTHLGTHKIAEVNDAYVSLLGWTKDELVGHLGCELGMYAPETRDRLLRQLEQSGLIRHSQETLRAKDGSPLIVSVSMKLIDIDGEAFTLTTLVDETERKRVEAELLSSDDRLRELAEMTDDVYWVTNAARDRLLYISPAYERVWGRSAASVYENAHDWLEAVHPEDRKRMTATAADFELADGYEDEFRIIRPDGTTRWIRGKVFTVRDAAGRAVRSVGALADITKQRVLEEQLRQTQKMESLGLLAGGVAHDFNNILTIVTACSELLGESIPHDSPDRELVAEIDGAVTRATQLTRQLLAFSRKQLADPVVLDPNALIKDTCKMLRRMVGEDVLVALSLESELPRVRIDSGSMVQVLMNLAVNARDAMPAGGTLTISTRTCQTEAFGPAIVVSVTDTGMGMDTETQRRIFEPFFTTKERGKGTGLGLAVAHGIVAQAGGRFEVESQLGIGTTFRICFPCSKVEPAATNTDVAQSPAGTEAILLVDDDEYVLRSTARALRSRGYFVHEANGGYAALQVLGKQAIDLLVTDVVMPGMSGRTLVETAASKGARMPVLYMSGYTDDAIVRQGVQRGEVELIEKPFRLEALTTRVRHLLDEERGRNVPTNRN